MVKLPKCYDFRSPGPVDPALIAKRMATVEKLAERIACQPLTGEQADLATDAILAAKPCGVSVGAPWLRNEPASGGPPDARQTVLAKAAGLAAVAAALASLPNALPGGGAMALAEMHLAEAVRLQRSAGGAARGAIQTQEASAWWAPWVEQYRQLRIVGRPPGAARRAVEQSMMQAGAVLPSTGELPDNRTLRTRLTG